MVSGTCSSYQSKGRSVRKKVGESEAFDQFCRYFLVPLWCMMQNCPNGHVARVGLTKVKVQEWRNVQDYIDANKNKDLWKDPIQDFNIIKTHTDFLQKPSRRETSKWVCAEKCEWERVSAEKCKWEKDETPKSNTPLAPSGPETIYSVQGFPGLLVSERYLAGLLPNTAQILLENKIVENTHIYIKSLKH